MESYHHFSVYMLGNAVVARLAISRVLDANQVVQIGQELSDLAATEGLEKLVLNFSEVEYLCSAALGKLIVAHKTMRRQGKRLYITSLRPPVAELFAATRLNELLEVCANDVMAMSTS